MHRHPRGNGRGFNPHERLDLRSEMLEYTRADVYDRERDAHRTEYNDVWYGSDVDFNHRYAFEDAMNANAVAVGQNRHNLAQDVKEREFIGGHPSSSSLSSGASLPSGGPIRRTHHYHRPHTHTVYECDAETVMNVRGPSHRGRRHQHTP